jgi:hypothetical protein
MTSLLTEILLLRRWKYYCREGGSSLGRILIFRRQLWGILADDWVKMLDIIHSTGDDKLRWTLEKKDFTVESLYNALQDRPVIKPFQKLWVFENSY